MPFHNDCQTLSEVTAAFEAYEQALLSNDVASLQNFFWNSPHAVRFGVTEQLYGHEEIASFRQARIPNFNQRQELKRSISTFGDSFASVMYEYISNYDDGPRPGRQSQTWVKIEGDWKIVSAHVSLASEPHAKIRDNLASLGLIPEGENLPSIQKHFETTAFLAGGLMAYPLPNHIEPAPVFQP
ncbi:AtzH-like domain-containing protein [Pelagicoccus sp. SDUM812002]|uniref:AtzH-like domain-containing protein n=1 Tax=Pelagicoccus sp. SDUM812002 TaxID=3041266 RepID=UPI00280D7132|nr:AtzH-like domain-containing protein [Pelagicoccus sp. SDUM812002]MDQ8187975.1 DUF3225 domain-containing protein [Pelagicoccus sp. SDUM812002]